METLIDQKDKRLLRIHITEKGKKLLSRHTEWISKSVTEIVSCFSEDELQQFKDYLKRLYRWSFQISGIELVKSKP